MKLYTRFLPFNSMPYKDERSVVRMMTRLFEDIPYLPLLPNLGEHENIIDRTLWNFGGLKAIKDGYKLIPIKQSELLSLDIAYREPILENLKNCQIQSVFWDKFIQIIERLKPKYAVVNLYGIFSIIKYMESLGMDDILVDKISKKSAIQSLATKAMWCILTIKSVSPKTKTIILFEEPDLHKFSHTKRNNDEINNETLIEIFSKVFDKVHEVGGVVGVQCFSKCDWSIPIDAGVDIISFDAYHNPYNLHVIAKKLNSFLAKGGIINWAIVPAVSDTAIKTMSYDGVYSRLIKYIEMLTAENVDIALAYNNTSISVLDSLDKLSVFFAEKALMIAMQVSKKIPTVQG